MSADRRLLVLGWGNPGRLDDGLGPAFAEALAASGLEQVEVESAYQLNIEDAATIADHRRVLFVDADRTCRAPFRFERLAADRSGSSFTTHSIGPGAALALSRDLFASEPAAWLLGIRGYEFDGFGEGLSRRATENLAAALAFVRQALEEPSDVG